MWVDNIIWHAHTKKIILYKILHLYLTSIVQYCVDVKFFNNLLYPNIIQHSHLPLKKNIALLCSFHFSSPVPSRLFLIYANEAIYHASIPMHTSRQDKIQHTLGLTLDVVPILIQTFPCNRKSDLIKFHQSCPCHAAGFAFFQ